MLPSVYSVKNNVENILFMSGFTSAKIDGAVVSLSFAVNMARFDNINADGFT
jgi:hypothetical protein